MYRLMQTTSPQIVGERLAELRLDERAGGVTVEAVDQLSDLFGRRNGDGIRMAAAALTAANPESQITAVATSYVARMLDAAR